jgi:uncharacterized coiled-coil protein SlyX
MLNRLFKRPYLIVIGLAVLLLLLPLQSSAIAQSVSGLSARLSRLESQNTTLRAQVSQLSSQVSRLSNAAGIRFAQPVPPSNSRPGQGTLSSDPMFDRLATLAIEQKERMDRLEARLNALEARLGQ